MQLEFNNCRCTKLPNGTVLIDAMDMAAALESIALQATIAKVTVTPDYIKGLADHIRDQWVRNFQNNTGLR